MFSLFRTRACRWASLGIFLATLSCLPFDKIHGQLREFYFYRPDIDYGSNASFSPFSAFLNGGFDLLRNTYDTRVITKIKFGTGFQNVAHNIIHAPRIIREYDAIPGHNFWKEQMVPTDLGVNRSPWVPNYQSHLIGEGMVCRQLAEWYASRQAPMPYLWAVLNTFSFQYMNESVEHGWSRYETVDPISDMLIFNPAGWILFYFDPVARFFGQTLHMANWSLQPSYNPYNHIVANAGEQFIIKLDIPKIKKVQIFYGWGIDGTVGLSYKSNSGLNYSTGYGLKARRLKASIEQKQSVVYPELEPNFVFYIDRRESLLLSVNQTGIHEIHTIVNIYPGYVLPKHFGVYVGLNTYLGVHFGVTYAILPFGLFAGG